MLIVKTSVGRSGVAGLGLFAAEFIPARRVVWRKHPLSRHSYAEEEFAQLPIKMQDMILFYGYMDIDTGRYEIDLDNARFANHSDYPNVFNSRNEIEMIARVDIHAGEEITINYRRLDKMASPELVDRFPYRHFLKQEA
jgi:uncharacterized protein